MGDSGSADDPWFDPPCPLPWTSLGVRGSAAPTTSRPGRAVGTYRSQVHHVHPSCRVTQGLSASHLGLWPHQAQSYHIKTIGVAQPTCPLRCGNPWRCLARAQPDRGAGVTNGSGVRLRGAREHQSGPGRQWNDGLSNGLVRSVTRPRISP